jgi:hypothetical protein
MQDIVTCTAQLSELVTNFLRQDNASSDAPPKGDTLHTGSSSLPNRQCGGRFGEKKRTNVDRQTEFSTNDAANIWCPKQQSFVNWYALVTCYIL